ncbi:MAG: hypothetical protein L7S62_02560, partial [Flavobacteriales bacterium]|nr:hypothetical protein [Flavobacteriales bacterium]
LFSILNCVFAAAIGVLIGGEHDHWRIKCGVLPLGEGRQVADAVSRNGGKPANWAGHGAGFEWRKW